MLFNSIYMHYCYKQSYGLLDNSIVKLLNVIEE